MEWQPIETAPKDGTFIDLWTVSADGEGRVTFCRWGQPMGDYFGERPRPPEGWVVDGEVYGEMWLDSVDQDYGTPTHWMPIPLPPVA